MPKDAGVNYELPGLGEADEATEIIIETFKIQEISVPEGCIACVSVLAMSLVHSDQDLDVEQMRRMHEMLDSLIKFYRTSYTLTSEDDDVKPVKH